MLRRNHAASSKVDGFHVGLAPKWIGLFEVERRLRHGVYLLKTTPPVKVQSVELKLVKQPLRDITTTDAAEEADPVSEVLSDVVEPRYNLRPRKP